ncbi:MAG TPA: hypothetical protein DEO43_05780 [Halieaceae bacterium]|nr:hypothetical protein [Halieaceae bacterium]
MRILRALRGEYSAANIIRALSGSLATPGYSDRERLIGPGVARANYAHLGFLDQEGHARAAKLRC